MANPHRVVIVGGGFGGLNAAMALRKAPVQVTLVDKRNFHLFQPLLYQVATGGLSPANITAPLRSILRKQKNCQVLMAEVTDFDPRGRRVLLADGELEYDSLIVATGARYNYFGHDEWPALAPGLKTIEDATTIRRRVLSAFEQAERETDAQTRQMLMTFVIIGAGPTGVELAGALAEVARHALKYDFRHIDPGDARIYLIDAETRVLPPFPPELSGKAAAALDRLGVQTRYNCRITDIQPGFVVWQHGDKTETIPTRTVLWAAGVQGTPLAETLAKQTGVALQRGKRVPVQADLSLAGHPEIYAIGDMSWFQTGDQPPLPGLAPVAIQQGRHAARMIQNRIQGKPTSTFVYKDKGTMATVGRSAAVVDLGWWKFGGFFAWLTWLFVHLMLIVQFENRMLVLMQWAWNYLTHNRSARVITEIPSETARKARVSEQIVANIKPGQP